MYLVTSDLRMRDVRIDISGDGPLNRGINSADAPGVMALMNLEITVTGATSNRGIDNSYCVSSYDDSYAPLMVNCQP